MATAGGARWEGKADARLERAVVRQVKITIEASGAGAKECERMGKALMGILEGNLHLLAATGGGEVKAVVKSAAVLDHG